MELLSAERCATESGVALRGANSSVVAFIFNGCFGLPPRGWLDADLFLSDGGASFVIRTCLGSASASSHPRVHCAVLPI